MTNFLIGCHTGGFQCYLEDKCLATSVVDWNIPDSKYFFRHLDVQKLKAHLLWKQARGELKHSHCCFLLAVILAALKSGLKPR